MKLVQVVVEVKNHKDKPVRLGTLLFDCGLLVGEIHFAIGGNQLYVNYPAVKDRYQVFHPSFGINDPDEDNAVKTILRGAYDKTFDNGGRTVYGNVKESCEKDLINLSPEDLEWDEIPRETSQAYGGIRYMPISVSVAKKSREFAYVQTMIGSEFTISNIRVSREGKGETLVQYPNLGQNSLGSPFITEEDKQYVYEAIKREVIFDDQRNQENEEGKTIDEDGLRQILWSASKNGYLPQKKILKILKHVDWKASFDVSNISELVEKMDFLSVRQLESLPGYFENWVSISFEKETVAVGAANPASALSKDIKRSLRSVLSLECKRAGGQLDLCAVKPTLETKYSSLYERLPKRKLKAILSECEFIAFEGGPTPPIYIRVIDSSSGKDQVASKEVIIPRRAEKSREIPAKTVSKSAAMFTQKNRIAEANPFKLFPQTRLISENSIPGNKLPAVTSQSAMKYYSGLSSRGQLNTIDLEIIYWISTLKYSKNSFIMDLLCGGLIDVPPEMNMSPDKLNKRLLLLYKAGLVSFYKLSSNVDGTISQSVFRVHMITPFAHTELRAIGRQSVYSNFMKSDNTETILKKLSINQWFTKFARYFPGFSKFSFNTVVSAQLAAANAARISLIVDYGGRPAFVTSIRRGLLHDVDVRSGDYAFWIIRVINLLNNYENLYLEEQTVLFSKQPLMVFVCEDIEHCYQVYNEIQDITNATENNAILDSLCFATDLDVFNKFLDAHFKIDENGTIIPVSIADFFEVNIKTPLEENAEDDEISEFDREYIEEIKAVQSGDGSLIDC